MNQKDLVRFDTLSIGGVFINPRNGWVYKRITDSYRSKGGRAEFVKTDISAEHLVGKTCSYPKSTLVKPHP